MRTKQNNMRVTLKEAFEVAVDGKLNDAVKQWVIRTMGNPLGPWYDIHPLPGPGAVVDSSLSMVLRRVVRPEAWAPSGS